MPVPTRLEAARALVSLDPPDWLLRHSLAVADIAAALAHGVARAGRSVDRALVEAAALLHDLDKALPGDHPLRVRGHGYAGAAWLAEHGHSELSGAVANHPVTRLADDEHWRRWSREAPLEEKLVAYADKRAAQRLVAMSVRFAEWRRRYPDHEAGHDASWRRALSLEAEVCAAAGVAPAQVTRLAWAGRAVRAARTAAP
jgi:putative nucleotidyltransferase with HDIG domain